jgi:hypothetical protein
MREKLTTLALKDRDMPAVTDRSSERSDSTAPPATPDLGVLG